MIIRRKHTANFTTIGNALFNDERLAADEIGIIGYLLSRPHDWEVRRPQLAKRFRYGREAIKRVMWSGMRFGWIVAVRTRLSDGRLHVIYEIRDHPGPELSDDEIRSALSLASSEANDIDDGDAEAGTEPVVDPPPDTGQPATGDPATGQPATGNPYVAYIESTKNGFTKDESTKGVRVLADVIGLWPPDHILSRVTAEAALASLTDADFDACKIGILPYLADCKASNRKVCDLTTFVKERRWERFQAKARPSLVSIKPHTIEAHRWREYWQATEDQQSLTILATMTKLNRDITVPSQWPPPLPPKSESAA